jgi:cell division protein FtsL
MIKLIKKILGVDVEIESLNTKVNRMEKALTDLKYKVADLSVICTFLNELRKEENNENNK